MANQTKSRKAPVKEVHKPFLKGEPTDELTLKSSLVFFGSMIVVAFVTFIACTSTASAGFVIRLIMNALPIAIILVIFYNNGTNQGTDAVARGEILYQKEQKGRPYTSAEKRICFHPLKGYIIGLLGTMPFLILAVILALNAKLQTTDAGAMPSWMQVYVRRSDIGNALISYTQPEGLVFLDYVRIVIRIMIMPFVNLFGFNNKEGLLLLERLSPILLILPAAAYGTGYLTGKKVRVRIHTAISVNEQKRVRKEKRKRNSANNRSRKRETEQLN